MVLSKGSYVRHKKLDKTGIVSDIPSGSSFVHVQWLQSTFKLRYYLEFVHIDDIEELPPENVRLGLHELRKKILA